MLLNSNFYSFKNLIFLIFIFQILRIFALNILSEDYTLYFDEAYYWGWSKNLDFGYYSKPPMIAWVIFITTYIFGDSEVAVKIGSTFIHSLTTIIMYLLALRLFNDNKIAFYSAIIFITMPAVSLSSLIISTDVVLLFYWAFSLYLFVLSIQTNKLYYWIITGLIAGCGMLSKYNMAFFLVSAVLFMLITPQYRYHLKNKNFYITIIITFLVFLPNLYWQYMHNFVSFVHTKEISKVDTIWFKFGDMISFIGSQFFVFGPIVFTFLLFLLFKRKFILLNENNKLLFSFILPMFIFIILLSLLGRAFANWGAPVYIAATLVVVSYLIQNNKTKFVVLSIIIHILLAFILYSLPYLKVIGIELSSKTNFYKRVWGMDLVAKEVSQIKLNYPDTKFIFDDRETMAEMIYYIAPHPFDAMMFNPDNIVTSQYHLKNSFQEIKNEKYLFLTNKYNLSQMQTLFDNVELVSKIEFKLYENYKKQYNLFLVSNLKVIKNEN